MPSRRGALRQRFSTDRPVRHSIELDGRTPVQPTPCCASAVQNLLPCSHRAHKRPRHTEKVRTSPCKQGCPVCFGHALESAGLPRASVTAPCTCFPCAARRHGLQPIPGECKQREGCFVTSRRMASRSAGLHACTSRLRRCKWPGPGPRCVKNTVIACLCNSRKLLATPTSSTRILCGQLLL